MNSGIFKVFCIPKVFVVVGISVIISACAGDQNLNGEVDGEPEMGLEMMPETGIMPEPEMMPESEPEPEPETGMMPEPEMMPDKMDPLGLKAIVRSKGCGMPASSAKGQWVQQPTLKIGNRNRNWHVRLPDNYDPNRAYPLTFEFHGCGSKTNNIPMEKVAGKDAIHVRGDAVESCWNDLAKAPVTNETESYDLPFIDEMLKEMKEMSCVDENRIFGVGYSSGGWLATILACKRANVFRGLGSVAGADWVHIHKLKPPQCSEGNVARIFISDTNDTGSNRWDNHKSAEARLVTRNGCKPGSEMPVETKSCVRFQGCEDHPIQRCITSGAGHGRQDNYAPQAFWTFFSKF